MNWEKFSSKFHPSWHSKIKPFIESEECDKIYAFLKKEAGRGKKIAPDSINTFRAFFETPLDEVKVVIVGMCPYHTFKNGSPVADGLALSCSITEELQPSLDQFYNALEVEFYNGLNLNYEKTPDLSYLAQQGVLLLNTALTTEKDKAGSHLKLWEPFMKYLFENIINDLGVPVVFLGKEASKLKRYTGIFMHVFELSHPASASYIGTNWETNGVFRKVDAIIDSVNGESIMWLYNAEPPF
jgi:uracil-DNA glycosylase